MRNFYTAFLFILFNCSFLAAQDTSLGILNEPAPDWNIPIWIDANGKSTTIKQSDYEGKVIFIMCFQSWCPGCHSVGFPTLKYLYNKFKTNDDIVFLSVQTVFEGKKTNNAKALKKTQKKYDLPIPFGHDNGSNEDMDYSNIMRRYKSGGTPWVIIIDKAGKVVFNDFNIEPEEGRKVLKRESEQ